MTHEHIEDPSDPKPAAAVQAATSDPRGRGRGWRPLPIALMAALLVLVIAFAPSLWNMLQPSTGIAPVPIVGTPWSVEKLPGGATRVFGLDLPGTTLANARQRWGEEMAVAVMARRDESGALEAYVERYSAGGIEGRLVLAWAGAAGDIQRWRDRIEAERLDGGTLRHRLDMLALDEAGELPLVGVTFIPKAALTAELVRGRFGDAAERIDGAGGSVHWLYPSIGLAALIDPDGKDLLQYVAPADFESRLRAPLRP